MARILLIEPNHLLAKQYIRYLQSENHEIFLAKNAQAAINTADQSKPDIVIMELMLTGHSGVEFLYEFRSYPEWRDVPILILTRLSRADITVDDRSLKHLGVFGFLYKPDTSLQVLSKKLKAILLSVTR